MTTRQAPFALRVVQRNAGKAGIVYRRLLKPDCGERLDRIGSISTTAFSAAMPLLRTAVRAQEGPSAKLTTGPYHPLDLDWGARVGCYAFVASGLRNSERLRLAATTLQHADAPEAAWWLGLMMNGYGGRAVRALRIIVEAVE